MGDRAHIKLVSGYGDVYLYTHWGGSEMGSALLKGLTRGRDRWDDPDYLARILFDAMKGDDVTGLTGFGISASEPDGVAWTVDVPRHTVKDPKGTEWTFEDCCR